MVERIKMRLMESTLMRLTKAGVRTILIHKMSLSLSLKVWRERRWEAVQRKWLPHTLAPMREASSRLRRQHRTAVLWL